MTLERDSVKYKRDSSKCQAKMRLKNKQIHLKFTLVSRLIYPKSYYNRRANSKAIPIPSKQGFQIIAKN